MTSKPKVSVIIPVYNASEYLDKTIDNIINQTLNDIEIIFIDDASEDNSPDKLKAYKEKYPDKIVLIESKKNRGAGGARNLGLDAASGEYIAFYDADDIIKPDIYEKLYTKAVSGNYDMVDTGFYYEKTKVSACYTTDNLTGDLDDNKRSGLIAKGGYLWTKLIRKSCIYGENKVRFREGVILEDADFLFYLYATISRMGVLKETLYTYCDRASSASKLKDPYKYAENVQKSMTAIYDRVKDLPDYKGIQTAVEYSVIQLYKYGIFSCISSMWEGESDESVIKRIKEFKEIKDKLIKIPYKANKYVMININDNDLGVIESCDKDITELIEANR